MARSHSLLTLLTSILLGCIGSSSNSAVKRHPPSQDFPGIRFPTVTVSDLDGNDYELPAQLPNEFTVVVLAFSHKQREQAAQWITSLRELSLPTVRIPVIDASSLALRTVIRNGMRSKLLAEDRQRTMTLFTDQSDFLGAVQCDGSLVYVALLDRSGKVLWSSHGDPDDRKLDELKKLYFTLQSKEH